MTLLYFSPVRWDDYPQRPHSFVRHFLARPGRSVVWFNPSPSRFPMLRDLHRSRGAPALTPRPPCLEVVEPRSLPIEPVAPGRWLNRRAFHDRLLVRVRSRLAGQRPGVAIGRPSELARRALELLDPAWSVYDAMDDFPEFYAGQARRSVAAIEQAIVDRVDLVLTPSSALWEKFGASGSKRVMVRNAFEMTSLPPVERVPSDRPVFGYVGCVSGWFDWPMLLALARRVPQASIAVVGPRFTEPADLPANVALFPACSHDETVRHLQRFSVGLIPFRRNRLTAGVDPIKYYAYRAMGLPVMTTTFGEMTRANADAGTFFMDGPADLSSTAAAALAARPDPAAVAEFRRRHDWRHRFDEAGLFDRVLTS